MGVAGTIWTEKKMNKKKAILKFFLPFVVIILGWAGMQLFIGLKKPPKKVEHEHLGVLVEAVEAHRVNHRVVISETGEVKARKEVAITPEVTGKVVWVSPGFERGRFVKKGQELFRIERINFEAEVAKREKELKDAELNLEEIRSKAEIARQEWKGLHGRRAIPKNPLVLYGPQLKAARARVKAARFMLKKALYDLRHTTLRAPFPAVILKEDIEVGRFVRSGENVGIIVGTESVEIEVPLSLKEALYLVPPGENVNKGISATVSIGAGDGFFPWSGVLDRFLPDVDQAARLERAILVVQDPYQLKKRIPGRPDLRIGQFVEVRIPGRVLKDVIPLPAKALKDEQFIWVATPEHRLHIVPADVAYRDKSQIFIKGGIKDGDLVVISNISGAAEGMRLRLVVKGDS